MKKNLLLIAVILTANLNAQDCSDLFISEYVEGPSNNNAIEIYNPSSNAIDLAGYTINRYGMNGSGGQSGDYPDVWPLSGTISSGQAIAVGNGQLDSVWVSTYWSLPVDQTFYTACDLHGSGIYPTPFYFNGNDAMTLEYNGNIIDVFGKVGEDPGNAWTDDVSSGYTDANGGTWWTKRQTLVRKSSVKKGVTMNPVLFNPTLEYDSLPDATYSNLGAHDCDCNTTTINEDKDISYVIYPNPATRGTEVSINANSYIKQIRVINSLGEQITFNKSINTTGLAKGTYIIDVEFLNGKFAKNKLIIE